MKKRFNWVLVAGVVLVLNTGAMGMNQKTKGMTERNMDAMTRMNMRGMDMRAEMNGKVMDERIMRMGAA